MASIGWKEHPVEERDASMRKDRERTEEEIKRAWKRMKEQQEGESKERQRAWLQTDLQKHLRCLFLPPFGLLQGRHNVIDLHAREFSKQIVRHLDLDSSSSSSSFNPLLKQMIGELCTNRRFAVRLCRLLIDRHRSSAFDMLWRLFSGASSSSSSDQPTRDDR